MTREAGLAVLEQHRRRLDPLCAKGFYLHGSLALGSYHHGTLRALSSWRTVRRLL